MVGLCIVMKQEVVLRHIGGLIGRVIGVDCSDQSHTDAGGE